MADISPLIQRGPNAAMIKEGTPVLKEGQMVYGQLKQMLPGQRAEVQIGSEKWTARLEMPMRAGDSYYFQVQATKPEIQLKVVAGPLQQHDGQGTSIAPLIDAMKLPKSDAVAALLSYVVKQKLPLSIEDLQKVSKWLESLSPASRSEALPVLKSMIELKLPLSESIFRTLLAGNAPISLQKQFIQFQQLLQMEAHLEASVKDKLLSPLSQLSQTTTDMKAATAVGQAFQVLFQEETHASTRFVLLQLMKDADLFPPQTSLANLSQTALSEMSFASTKAGASYDMLVQTLQQMSTQKQPIAALFASLQQQIEALEQLSPAQKQEWQALFMRHSSHQTVHTHRFIQEASFLLFRQIGENIAGNSIHPTSLSMLPPSLHEKALALLAGLESSPHPQIEQMASGVSRQTVSQLDGKVVADLLRQTIRSLGVNVEADLRSGSAEPSRLAESFKPQLIQLLQQSTLSPALRESAEQLLGRLNAPLLYLAEHTGQQQLTMQLPLEWFGKKMDATLQWSSRLKDDGKLDPNFARILFYLSMSVIGETVIDMQVQNRIVTLTVYQEKGNLQPIGAALQGRLQVGLEQLDYQLSGISYKPLHPEETSNTSLNWAQQSESGGVDIRI